MKQKTKKKTTMNNYCSKKKDEMMIKCYAKERVCAAQIDMQAKHFQSVSIDEDDVENGHII